MNIEVPRRDGHSGKVHAYGSNGRTKCNHVIADYWLTSDKLVTCLKCIGAHSKYHVMENPLRTKLHGLKAARKAAGYRPSILAKLLFISVKTYYRWEACKFNVALTTAAELSYILGVSLQKLIGNTMDEK